MATYTTQYTTDDERWQAVLHHDKQADGTFCYAVKTTGVYCRPSCPSRRGRRANVLFFATPGEAERAGFRPCKRCQPNQSHELSKDIAIINKACRLLMKSRDQLSLRALAAAVGMSPWYFHRVFKSITGITPKAYAAACRAGRMQKQLAGKGSVTSAIYSSGFNSSGRFYTDTSKRLGMTPTQLKSGGTGVTIRFAIGQCALGSILVAATDVGICTIALGDDPEKLITDFQDCFPNAKLVGDDMDFAHMVATVVGFVEKPAKGLNLPLDIQGTAFQQRVWKALCEIPCGNTRTYTEIAKKLGRPNATRAVAAACAANSLAVAIPCHRVVRRDGSLAGYRWGIERKEKLLRVERS